MALAALVVWLFLRDWRATAVTAIAMPASLIPTFAFMSLAGFSLNVVTLLGLTLVIGILVDDAIVEIENIEKRVYVGMRPYDAAIEGADQIGLAVVACTFAIVAVFLPVALMPGIPGQFFREFGITVSVAVLFSLVVARLLTPLMAAYFLKPKPARATAAAQDLTHAPGLGPGSPDHRRTDRRGGVHRLGDADDPAEEGRPAGGQSQLLLRQHRGAAGGDPPRHARRRGQGRRPARPPARDPGRVRPP